MKFNIYVRNPDGTETLFNREPYDAVQLAAFAETCAAEFDSFRVEKVPALEPVES